MPPRAQNYYDRSRVTCTCDDRTGRRHLPDYNNNSVASSVHTSDANYACYLSCVYDRRDEPSSCDDSVSKDSAAGSAASGRPRLRGRPQRSSAATRGTPSATGGRTRRPRSVKFRRACEAQDFGLVGPSPWEILEKWGAKTRCHSKQGSRGHPAPGQILVRRNPAIQTGCSAVR